MTWHLAATDEAWDEMLARASDADAFQSAGWGEFRRRAGWRPQRWVAHDGGGRPVMMAQVLTRTVMATLVGWAPGGPVLRFPASDPHRIPDLLDGLVSAVRGPSKRAYVRFDPHHPHDPATTYAFGRSCRRPLAPLNTRFSAVLDLRGPIEGILARMGHKHRYNTRRALEQPVAWTVGSDEREARALAELHAEVVRDKRLRTRPMDAGDLRHLCESFGDGAGILVGRSGGRPVTALLFLVFAGRAFLMLPATGPAGRAIGAGYAMHFRLFEELRRREIASLDMGGLDPRSRMNDVDRFKVGYGAEIVEYVGEWDWASAPWLRWAASAGVLVRRSAGLG